LKIQEKKLAIFGTDKLFGLLF